jgi:hypothetical protein
MRRVLGLLAVIGLVAALSPATVAAAKPIRESLSVTIVRCDEVLTTTAGLVRVYAEVFGEGSFVSISLTTTGDPEADPNVFSDSWTATFDDGRFSANAELVYVEEGPNPEDPPIITPAGSASLEAILTPVGDLDSFPDEPERIGNTWERRGLFNQPLSVEGFLRIELLNGTEATAELIGCSAATSTQTVFATNPNAYIVGGQQRFIECDWTTQGGSVELAAVTDDFAVSRSQLLIVDGDRLLLGLGNGMEYSETAYVDTYTVLDVATRQVVGSATAQAALEPSGERVDDREWVDGIRFSLVGDVMTVSGSLSISVDGTTTALSMDDAACDATDLRVRMIEKIAKS